MMDSHRFSFRGERTARCQSFGLWIVLLPDLQLQQQNLLGLENIKGGRVHHAIIVQAQSFRGPQFAHGAWNVAGRLHPFAGIPQPFTAAAGIEHVPEELQAALSPEMCSLVEVPGFRWMYAALLSSGIHVLSHALPRLGRWQYFQLGQLVYSAAIAGIGGLQLQQGGGG